jgi:hypothetical protein
MRLTRKELLQIIGAGAGVTAAARLGAAGAIPASSLLAQVGADAIITRDVAIIGGGSTGTYAAIKLRDRGASVVVVEANDRLGGHTHTYVDPVTGGRDDFGVIVWHDLPIVHAYFDRFKVPLVKATFGSPGTIGKSADFRTGRIVPGHVPANPAVGLQRYGAQLAKYPYLENGFDLPDPVPADLVLPFGDFVKKYALESAASLIFNFGQGLGDLLRQPTLYVLKNFGQDILRNIAAGSFLTTARRDNSELYRLARAELGADALLRSRVLATDRGSSGHAYALVQTPAGLRLIQARKLLVTIPPKLDNLDGFDLDGTERSLFGRFGNSGYYTGVLRNTGIPDNVSVSNIGADTLYHLPALPGVYGISPAGVPGLHDVKYGSPVALPDAVVKANIVADIKRMRAAGTLPASPATPEFATFVSHTPFELTVPAAAISAGFYRKLYALQGRNRTYWTGATFHTHDSSLLWQFTERVLAGLAP